MHHKGDCEFTLDGSATPEQRELFDDWIALIEEMRREEWGDALEEDELP